MTETTRLCRPFDREAEMAGAPISCRQVGYTPRIFERTLGALFGTVETPDGHKYAQEWSPDGHARNTGHRGQSQRDLVMVPLDWVQAQPVYHGDVVYKGRRKVAVNAGQSQAVTGNAPPWAGATLEPREPESRRMPDDPLGIMGGPPTSWLAKLTPAPAVPQAARVETNMTDEELRVIAPPLSRQNENRRTLANAAIARAIADGQVVPTLAATQKESTSVSFNGATMHGTVEACARMRDAINSAIPPRRQRLDEIVAAINAVAEQAPRIQLEQAAAAMQQAAVREILARGPELGWVGHERAAAVVRSLSVDEVVNKMLGVQS